MTTITNTPAATMERVRDQIRQAYADGSAAENTVGPGRRCLSFLASDFVDLPTAGVLVKYVGKYNAFDPSNLTTVFGVIQGADIDARIAFGREGSPVLYIETATQKTARRIYDILEAMSGSPDELWLLENPREEIGSSDILGDGIHNRCDHDEDDAPVPVGEEAEPAEGTVVIRAWWD